MKKPGKMVTEVLKNFSKKVATVKYPFVKFEMPQNFRGKLEFYAALCVGCKLCERNCPSNAIIINIIEDVDTTVEATPDKPVKKKRKFECVIDLDRCIYCAQCVDVCNKDALKATKEYELAALNRKDLRITYHAI